MLPVPCSQHGVRQTTLTTPPPTHYSLLDCYAHKQARSAQQSETLNTPPFTRGENYFFGSCSEWPQYPTP
eukprot:10541607-Prorocentrum_lima.AAC.1